MCISEKKGQIFQNLLKELYDHISDHEEELEESRPLSLKKIIDNTF